MKTELEIQRAHDLLVGCITGELPVKFTGKSMDHMTVTASVLCWVLDHGHNESFPNFLAELEKRLLASGFSLENQGN